jgi:hypothetical protein
MVRSLLPLTILRTARRLVEHEDGRTYRHITLWTFHKQCRIKLYSLQGCYVVSLATDFSTFQRVEVPSSWGSSGPNDSVVPAKHKLLFVQQHSTKCQKTCIYSISALRISSFGNAVYVPRLLAISYCNFTSENFQINIYGILCFVDRPSRFSSCK